ncbi:MAG: hypothetical protein R3F19_11905 [Verrucomicrobiales bacterium]
MPGTNHDIRNVDKRRLATLLDFVMSEDIEGDDREEKCAHGKTENRSTSPDDCSSESPSK